MSRALTLATIVLTAVAAMPSAAPAQLVKAGVVTTLHGTAMVTRASLAHPVPLKFKDDVFAQDRVTTGDDSVARILLGGKAIVTVRERSVLTITQAPGVATVDVSDGRAAIAVAKERMNPGESIEIRTPNAVAGIRGTIVVVEVEQAATDITTRFTVLRGEVLARQLQGGQPFGAGVVLGANQQARFTGLTAPVTQALNATEAGALATGFKATKTDPPAAVNAPLVTQSQTLATQVVTSGVSNSGTPAVPGSVTRAIQNSVSKSGPDKRPDTSRDIRESTTSLGSITTSDTSGSSGGSGTSGSGGSSGKSKSGGRNSGPGGGK